MWYPGFDDARRIKVWKGMIAKLQRERKDVKIPYDLNKYIERDEDLKKVEWNGREIRNGESTQEKPAGLMKLQLFKLSSLWQSFKQQRRKLMTLKSRLSTWIKL
jgi:hypothetical protein